MAAPSYTYTLTNGTAADASQVMQNFNDILNGITDGTKDLSINALTCAGTVTLNGNVNLGNASGDDITVTGSLASTIPIKTNTTYDIGSTTKGLQALYLGGTSTFTAKLLAATLAASRNYTVPDAGADASFLMTQGAQTKAGALTLSNGLVLGGGGTNLNHYEETTWTPARNFSSSNGTSSSTGTGTLTRIGRIVFFKGYVSITKGDRTTQALSISGLPYASSSTTATFSCTVVYTESGVTQPANRGAAQGYIDTNGTVVNLTFPSTTGSSVANVTGNDLSATSSFMIEGFYFT